MRPNIADWLEGKTILITGGTGFMGKVLIEKLLRCCPKINAIYLIIRCKKGIDPHTRLQPIIDNQLFQLLDKNSGIFNKLVVLPGDMSEINCGLSDEHIQMIKENVSVVFHTAASVRFDDSMSYALKLNTRGTHELLKIAKEIKKLEVFQYVSTTYCNVHIQEKVEEKVYPAQIEWKTLLNLLETDGDTFDILVYKLLNSQPNTYTFSKSLAENVVLDASKDVPTVIVRPSVVISVLEEPVPGWIDNVNGVIGVTLGVSKGVLRTIKCSPDAVMDYLPVDYAINGMLTAAWTRRFYDEGEIQVYNEVYSDTVPVTYSDLVNHGIIVNETYPLENYIWYPFIVLTNNAFYYHILFYFLQLIPALIIDLLLVLLRKKTILLKLYIKIYNATTALSQFTHRPFSFGNVNFKQINDKINEVDKKIFYMDHSGGGKQDVLRYMLIFQFGLKKYLLNEKEEDQERYRRNRQRLYYIDRATRIFLIGFVAWKVIQWGCYIFE